MSRTAYAALFGVIGTVYGEGDGETTFNLPDMEGRFLQGSSGEILYHKAGLPNITGSWVSKGATFEAYTGAFVGGTDVELIPWGGTSGVGKRPTFNASRSNSIYGASTTVQPPAVTTLFCIKY